MIPTVTKYWREKEAYDASHKMQLTTPAPQNSPLFNYAILFKNIEDRDNMSESELRYFIQRNFQSIMNNIFGKEIGIKYIDAFQDVRFLDAFIDVLNTMQFFDSDVIIRLNLLAYHYLTSPIKKLEISSRMLSIGSIINRSKLIAFKKFNLPQNLENVLIIARYSDFDLNICVKRVNLILDLNPELLQILDINESYECSEESIDWLARILMELYRIEDWRFVLPYFMLNPLPDPDIDINAAGWITPEVEAVDSALNLAVLKILDELVGDSIKLRGILISYAEGYRILNKNITPRFSFQSISEEYQRLNNVINYLEVEENIYVP